MNQTLMVGLFSFALALSQVAQAQTQPSAPSNPAHQQEVMQIEKIVHDYLLKNPEVLVEASQVYQDREMAKAKTKTQEAVAKNSNALFNSANSPTLGNRNADVTVVEFLDYQCTHCKEMATIVEALLKSDPKLRIVIKELPIFGNESKYAAEASIAAVKQGESKYLVFYKALLLDKGPLNNEKVLEVAKKAGLNVQQLQNDMKNKAVSDQIDSNFKLAQDLGLLGTPAIIIADRYGKHIEYIPGSVSLANIQSAISKARKKS
jgi:protein-disulfide isomerase